MIRSKDLDEHFYVQRVKEHGYILNDIHAGSCPRFVHRYLCTAKKHGRNKMVIEGYEPTDDIEELKRQAFEKADSMPYPSSYYNPLLREGTVERMVMYDFMRDLGFKIADSFQGMTCFMRQNKTIYGFEANPVYITFHGLDWYGQDEALDKQVVKINFSEGGNHGWVSAGEIAFNDIEGMKDAVKQLLKPDALGKATDQILFADKIGQIEKNVEMLREQLVGLTPVSIEVKADIKQRLLDLANQL